MSSAICFTQWLTWQYCVTPTSQSVYFEDGGIVSFSKVSSSSKLRKESCCQYMNIFRLPSNWLLFMTRITQEDDGAFCTDWMLLCVCFRGRLASVCRARRKYSPRKPSPSHQVRLLVLELFTELKSHHTICFLLYMERGGGCGCGFLLQIQSTLVTPDFSWRDCPGERLTVSVFKFPASTLTPDYLKWICGKHDSSAVSFLLMVQKA